MGITLAAQRFAPTAWLKKNVRNSCISSLLILAGMLLSSFTATVEDKNELEALFRTLFSKSEWGYTLFGDKPMSFYDYFIKPPKEFLIYSDLLDPKLERHFITLAKYTKHLASSNFLILDQPLISKKFPTSGYVRDLIIINKKAFLQTISENEALFKTRLGPNSTPEALLKKAESGVPLLTDILKEDELLIGLLLGYGKHNAQQYSQKEDCLTAFSREYFLDLIPLPLFLCDPTNSETQQLKHAYKETQKEIYKIYQHSDFLDLILDRLHSAD